MECKLDYSYQFSVACGIASSECLGHSLHHAADSIHHSPHHVEDGAICSGIRYLHSRSILVLALVT